MNTMIEVTCAIIRNEDNEILVVQRGENSDHPFKWEFPGGKVTHGESEEECILREIDEELSIGIVICGRLEPVEHDYGNKKIRLIPFICDTLDDKPVLAEHYDYKWLPGEKLFTIDFSEADIPVAIQYLRQSEKSGAEKDYSQVSGEKVSSTFNEEELKSMINNMMSMQEADWLATSALENPVLFSKLLEYSYSHDKKLAFRASWTISKVCDKFPAIILPHLDEIVKSLPKSDNESVIRSFLRILSLNDLEKLSSSQHGLLADYCFTSLADVDSAVAIKAYSMEILYKLALIYPELGNELAISIRILMENGSAGIVARGNMILKKISEIPLNR